jgi:hypothetical protein
LYRPRTIGVSSAIYGGVVIAIENRKPVLRSEARDMGSELVQHQNFIQSGHIRVACLIIQNSNAFLWILGVCGVLSA